MQTTCVHQPKLYLALFTLHSTGLSTTQRFQACTVKKSRPCRGTFARTSQADHSMNLLHCAQRSTFNATFAWCERKVECFSLFERYVTLPVGTWLIALEQSSRSQCGRLLRTSQSQKEVSTIDKRTDHRKALDRLRFVRDCPSPRPDQRRLVVCSPRSWSKLRELVEGLSSP